MIDNQAPFPEGLEGVCCERHGASRRFVGYVHRCFHRRLAPCRSQKDDRRELNPRRLASQTSFRTNTERSTCRLQHSVATSAGDRNRTCDLLVQSQTQRPTVATPGQCFLSSSLATRFSLLATLQLRGQESNLHHDVQSIGSYR